MIHFQQLLHVALAGLPLVWEAMAQGVSNVTCTTATWTFNDRHQSPCQVGATLEVACTRQGLNVPPLTPGDAYSGASVGQSNVCICSSVVYSMLSACAACQGGGVGSWTNWTQNCNPSDISISKFPLAIPPDTSVPTWAYINVSTTGVWDLNAAQANQSAGAPDSSLGGPTPTSTSHSSSTSSSHAGPIAGGVVGGLVGVIAVILAALILYRRKRRSAKQTPSSLFQKEKVDIGDSTPPTQMVVPAFPIRTEILPPRVYDPSDPSTFPPTPQPSLPGYTISGHTDSDIASPTFSAPFSSTTSYDPLSGQHGRHQSEMATNVSTVTQSTHDRNLSGGSTISSPTHQHVGYSTIPEI